MNDNFKRDSILDFLVKNAPQAKIGECLTIANQCQQYFDEKIRARKALAILSETVIGFDSQGNLKNEIIDKFQDNKAVLWALEEVFHTQGGVICGTPGGSMKECLKEKSEELEKSRTKLMYLIHKEENSQK